MIIIYKREIESIVEASERKIDVLQYSRWKYIIASILGGQFVGFGVILAYSVGGYLDNINILYTKIGVGLTFGIALSLVLMAGGELFTSNAMIMTVGFLEGKVKTIDTIKILAYSYLGNLIGSLILSIFILRSGIIKEPVQEYITKTASLKMTISFSELIIRGILCNMLVCISTWCSFKLKEETAKLIVVFWCLFAFVTSGYEHSVANMTLLPLGVMTSNDASVSVAGILHNLIPVTIGNFIGGGILIGLPYWYIANRKDSK